MATYTIRSYNRIETTDDLDDAKAIARRRAEQYAAIHGGVAVWCTPDAWSTDEDHRSHGGYAIDRGYQSWDDAAGAAVIDEDVRGSQRAACRCRVAIAVEDFHRTPAPDRT